MQSFDWQGILLKVALAIVILVATWIIASVVKWAARKLVGKVPALQRTGNDGKAIGDSLGTVASLLVLLFGLMAILQLFALDQVLAPLQDLLGGILGFLPNLIGAAFVFFIGFVFAKIAASSSAPSSDRSTSRSSSGSSARPVNSPSAPRSRRTPSSSPCSATCSSPSSSSS